MLSRRRRVIALAAAPLILTACEPEKASNEPKPAVLAVVGAETISVEDFQAAALRRGGGDPSSVDRAALLDELITESALVQRAKAEKLDQSPEFRRRQRALLIAMLHENEPPRTQAAKPSDAELQSLYEELKPKLAVPAARHLAWLRLTEGQERLAEAVKRFQALPADPSRRGFGPVAAEFSDDQDTRYIGGDLGWLTPDDIQRRLPAPVAQAALALSSPASCTAVITDGPASYVVMLTEVREASTMPFEKARSRLISEFNQRHAAAEAKTQREAERKGLNIQIDEPLLKAVKLEARKTSSALSPPQQ